MNLNDHTPMMQQYLRLKSGYPHALVLYRMGDFYELFFEDAKVAADILGITLTRRGKDKQGHEIAMAGVPFHSADGYIARLINAGQTVVVCEQVEASSSVADNSLADAPPHKDTPPHKKTTHANAPKIMERKVVRTLTAGTLTDDNLITQGQIPTVVAVSFDKSALTVGLAQLNLSQGSVQVTQLSCDTLSQLQHELTTTLSRLDPSEILIDEQLAAPWQHFLQDLLCQPSRQVPIIQQPHSHFLSANASEHLRQHLGVTTLAGVGLQGQPQAMIAASVVLHYGKQTQQSPLAHICHITCEKTCDYLQLDAISQQNLEIFKPVLATGISLLSVIDHCQTPMGRRALVHHLHRPLLDRQLINRRLDAVEQLMSLSTFEFEAVLKTLASVADIERIGGRIGLGTAKPTDLAKLRSSLQSALTLHEQLQHTVGELASHPSATDDAPLLTLLTKQLPCVAKDDLFADMQQLLTRAIVAEPPAHTRDGGMIKSGYDQQLDQLYHLHDNIEQTLDALAAKEREQNNLPTLKVGFNKVSGFYFELSALQAKHAPVHFSRRQTLKNAERFITPELKTIEESYLSAQGQALGLEKQLYDKLLEELQTHLNHLQSLSKAIAHLDVLVNWVTLTRQQPAAQSPWCRPTFGSDDHAYLRIKDGRHLVVEAGQQRGRHSQDPISASAPDAFIANDCVLGIDEVPEKLMLITGPNMGGKSTYMRQTALIVLLACCGSFVPASSADIGRIERIFTRIGAADDLASGKSTFMVEMIETANIMNQANAHALVLMDEVGRGTSTQDGLAIAHACVNYLADTLDCLTLFATHYFELTDLAAQHPKMLNQHLVTQEVDGQLLLLHKIAKGSTHRSFGLHVAKMAGVPTPLLQQAQQFLDSQLANSSATSQAVVPQQLPKTQLNPAATRQLGLSLSSSSANYQLPIEPSPPPANPIMGKLTALNPDNLTPKQALDFIYSLKELLNHD